MPELPEAEVVARQLRVHLLGAQLNECLVGREDIVREGLPTLSWYHGARLEAVERYGKSVALGFKREDELRYVVAELGMTGLLLFRVKLHPNREVNRLREATISKLYDTMQAVLHESISCGGSSVKDFYAPDGTEGRYKRCHLVYGKEGQPCPNRCGRMIRRLQSERSSFFCPACQSNRLPG